MFDCEDTCVGESLFELGRSVGPDEEARSKGLGTIADDPPSTAPMAAEATTGESDSAGMVTMPSCELDTVAGSVGTVNWPTVDPFSSTTWITVATTTV